MDEAFREEIQIFDFEEEVVISYLKQNLFISNSFEINILVIETFVSELFFSFVPLLMAPQRAFDSETPITSLQSPSPIHPPSLKTGRFFLQNNFYPRTMYIVDSYVPAQDTGTYMKSMKFTFMTGMFFFFIYVVNALVALMLQIILLILLSLLMLLMSPMMLMLLMLLML